MFLGSGTLQTLYRIFDEKVNIFFLIIYLTLRKKYPYSEFFWSVFSRIRTEYEEILRISLYSIRMQENTGHKNSEYGNFSRSVKVWFTLWT